MAHRTPQKKYINFLIIPDGKEESRSFRLSVGMVRFLIVVTIILFFLISGGFIAYWKLGSLVLENNHLKEENFKLVKSLKQVDQLKEQLVALQNFQKKIRSSFEGYINVEESGNLDSVSWNDLNFEMMDIGRERSLFNNIPSLIPVEGFIARGYEPSSLISDAHLGIDIAAKTDTPIRAPADGVVLFEGWTNDGGNVLIILHSFGFITVYKHNQINLVKELEQVRKGQVIALLGNTGKITSGPHLHYEIWRNSQPVNPINYLNER
ncbi:M23 family metallopeptidase [Caldithrix abyssi]|uniref:Peptidase M23 n=1 Tax=Caldithrix abyssi DSM 13497 TaxID=880073 RepID=H1XNV0_CALAY|nr:M23 family metallopeptidase [Caldithrix abyssi]APF19785.1 Peptidase family M23 [Caldithrix abyssi DSM 13497]EHO39890.1 Peptidase M23 [Caldithrix abyssi DSM 13497]